MRLKIGGHWEPGDFIVVLRSVGSLSYLAFIIGSLRTIPALSSYTGTRSDAKTMRNGGHRNWALR